MKCQEYREEMVDYLEGLLDGTARNWMDAHVAECPSCKAELNALQELTARLTRNSLAVSAVSLEAAVMDRILHEQALQLRRLKMRKRLRVLGMSGAMAAAIAVMLFGSLWFAQTAAAEKTAAQVLAQGAEATPRPSNIHIVAKMRTIPHDNFGMIGADYDLVPIEVWRQFGDKPKWRAEKSGRTIVVDGASTTMLIRPDYVVQIPQAYPPGACDTGCLMALTEVEDMITRELRAAQARKWNLTLTHATTGSGDKMLVTVEAKSGLPADDYLKNKFFEISDTRRVYRFDAETKRLEGFDAYLHRDGGDVLILSVEHIEYDKPIDPAVFKLKLPNKVSVYQEPERLPDNEKYEKMTPEQAARAFFDACGKKDWDEAQKFFWPCDERIQGYLGGLKLVSLGKPFQSKGYGGWFVPYEIKITFEVQFVVSYDNPAKRCVVFNAKERPDPKLLAQVQPLPDNEKYQKMTPKEAVQALFKASEKNDVDEAWRLTGGLETKEKLKKDMDGPQISDYHVGEPTPAKEPGCWNVPIEIRAVKKHNIALRNDNPAKRFVVDGGI